MRHIKIEATTYSPLIDFSPCGKLELSGRAKIEDASKLFDPMIKFVDELEVNEVKFKINLEYFNTASSKKLLELLQHLDSNSKIAKIFIQWFFEEGDEDSVETAEIYQELLQRTDFKYIEYAEC